MRVYIIRHGQSASNALRTFQSDPTLSSLGIKQAKKIAVRVAQLPFTAIISSDLRRTLQTAEIICKHVPKKLVITPLLREERHPSELEGRTVSSPSAVRIKKLLYKNRNRQRWHFSDEENFFDLKRRMKACMHFLKKRGEKNILVVGHTFSIRMLIGVMIFGDALTADVFQKMRDGFLLRNTGITVCDLIDGQWKLSTWNDHTHLG